MNVFSLLKCRPSRAGLTGVVFAAGLGLAAGMLPGAAQAQNTGVQELLNRVDRLQRELSTLQRQVYKGEAPPAAALPLSPGGGDPRNAARNSIRITQLENELQQLTGRIEEIGFRTQQIQARLEKLVADMDQRLTALEGGARPNAAAPGTVPQSASPPSNVGLTLRPPPGAQSPSALPPPPTPAARALSPPASAPARGAAPGVLGTIPKNMAVSSPRGPANVPPQPPLRAQPPAAAPAAPAAQSATRSATQTATQTAVLPAGTPQSQYDYALSLMLKQQDFAKAETALKAFIDTNPKDRLAGNAHYWLGETYYVRKSFQDAAFAFAEGFQKFPKGNKAPDSLLKLGMSLDRLEKRREACTAYSRLLSTFPKASARMKARVQRERSRAKCR